MPDFSENRRRIRTPGVNSQQSQSPFISDTQVRMMNAQRGQSIMADKIARAGVPSSYTPRKSTSSRDTNGDGVISSGERVDHIKRPDGTLVPVAAATGDPYLVRPKGVDHYVSPRSGDRFKVDPASPTGLLSIGSARDEAMRKAAEKQAKEDAAASKIEAKAVTDADKATAKAAAEAKKLANAQATDKLIAEGRAYHLSRETGTPLPVQTDEEFAKAKQEKMAKLQQEAAAKPYKKRLDELQLELSNPDLPKVTDKDLSDADNERAAAETELMAQRGTDDLATPLTDDEVKAALADPLRKDAANKLLAAREKTAALPKHVAKRLALEKEAYETKKRILDPLKYAADLKAEAPMKSDDELKAHADEINNRIKARDADVRQEAARITQKDGQFSQQYALTKQKYDEALTGGDPNVIGTLGDSMRDLEQQMLQWQGSSQDQRAAVDAESEQIKHDASHLQILADEQKKRDAVRQDQYTAALDAALPSAGQKYKSVTEDAYKRREDLRAKYPDPFAPEAKAAFDALNKDFEEKATAITKEADAAARAKQQKQQELRGKAFDAAQAAKSEIAKQRAADPAAPHGLSDLLSISKWKKAFTMTHEERSAEDSAQMQKQKAIIVEQMKKAGLDPENPEHQTFMEDAEKMDWSNAIIASDEKGGWGGKMGAEHALKGITNMLASGKDDSTAEISRTLSDGTLMINPLLVQDDAGYKKAVEKADAKPEAKAAALKQLPELQIQQAAALLPALLDTPKATPGESYESFEKRRETDPEHGEWFKGLRDGEKVREYFKEQQNRGNLVNVIDYLGTQAMSGLLQAGTMVLGTAGIATGFIPKVGEAISQTAAEGSKIASSMTATTRQETGAGGALRTVGQIANMAPPLALVALSGGRTAPMLGLSGMQTAGSQYAQGYQEMRDKGATHAEAWKAQALPAVASGIVTAALTHAGGQKGIEALYSPAGRAAAKEAIKSYWTALPKAFVKEGGREFLFEELPDELISTIIAAKASGDDPAKAVHQLIDQLPEFGAAIMLLGGAGGVKEAMQENRTASQPPAEDLADAPTPSVLPETEAARTAAIQAWTPATVPNSVLNATKAAHGKDATPEQQTDMARTAAHALVEIAAGGDPRTMSPEVRRVLGIKINSKDGSIVPASANVMPLVESVADPKGNHQPVITDAARAWLAKEVPTAAEAIKSSYAERVEQIKNPPKPAKKPKVEKAQPANASQEMSATKLRKLAQQRQNELLWKRDGKAGGTDEIATSPRQLSAAEKAELESLDKHLAADDTEALAKQYGVKIKAPVDVTSPATTPTEPAASPTKATTPPSKPAESVNSGQSSPKLPRELASAKPRWKEYELEFESDIDRAAYIAAQEKPSKRDADYLAFAMKHAGLSEPAVRSHGAAVRAYIKANTGSAKNSKTGPTIAIPSQMEARKPAVEISPHLIETVPEDLARAQEDRTANNERWQRAEKSTDPIHVLQLPGGKYRVIDGHHRLIDRLAKGQPIMATMGKAKTPQKEEKPQPTEQEKAPRGTIEPVATAPEDRKDAAQGLAGGALLAAAEKQSQAVVSKMQGEEKQRAIIARDVILAVIRRYNGHLPIDLAKGDNGFSFSNEGKVLINPRKAIMDVVEATSSNAEAKTMAEKLFDHEVIHLFATSKIEPARIKAVWNDLPQDVKNAVIKAYSIRLVASGQPAVDLNDFAGGHEYFRAMIEATRTGVLSEQAIGPKLAEKWKQIVLDFLAILKDLKKQFASIKSEAKRTELTARVEAIRKEISDALDQFERSIAPQESNNPGKEPALATSTGAVSTTETSSESPVKGSTETVAAADGVTSITNAKESSVKSEKQEAIRAGIPVKEVTTPAAIKEKNPADAKALREMKRYLLEKIDDAIATAGDPSQPKVVIEIPGDGTFTLHNNKKTLQEFAKKAKSFPTSTPAATVPKLTEIRPSGIPVLNKGKVTTATLVKVAGAFASTDDSRQSIMQVADFGDTLVATDGRMMFTAPIPGEGTEEDPVLYSANGARLGPQSKNEKFGKYPGWQVAIPQDAEVIYRGLDTGRLWQILKQASAVYRDTNWKVVNGKGQTENQTPYVQIFINPDNTIGVRGEADNRTQDGGGYVSNIDVYEHNMQPGAQIVGRFDADLFMSALAAFRAIGQEKVSIKSTDDKTQGAMILSSRAADVIIMRVKGLSPSEKAAPSPAETKSPAISPPEIKDDAPSLKSEEPAAPKDAIDSALDEAFGGLYAPPTGKGTPLDLSEAISAVEAFYADPSEPTNWPEDLQEDFEKAPLSQAVESTDFVAFYEALPENKRTKEFTQWYEEAKANETVQKRLDGFYSTLKKNPQAAFTADEWAALQASPNEARRDIETQKQVTERAIQQLTIPERKIYDDDLENLNEFWESDKPQEMAMAGFLPQVKERVQSTIQQIEALGRHKWDKTMQAFDELDEPQVLFQNPGPVEQVALPKDRRDAMMKAAGALVDLGLKTPQELAARLDKLAPNGALRQYARSFWRLMTGFDAELDENPDWQAIYAPKVEAPATAEPDAIRDLILSDDSRAKKAQAMKKLSQERGETIKETQEFVESRLVQIADEVARNGEPAKDRFDELVSIYDKQPLFSARTSTSMENQAYSTPAPMAFVLGHMTGVTPQTSVYDATAGNGMLEIGANLENSVANEIDETRRTGLQQLGVGTITNKDATSPVGAFKDRAKAQVVHLNPPFGGIPNTNFDGFGIRKLEHIISLHALKEGMADNGTAAIILGATMHNQEQSKGAQWVFENYLYGNYHVIDNFEVSGDLYGNQGAKWPVRILVIAGRRAVPLTKQDLAPKTVDRLETWDDVWTRAERTRHEVERQRQILGTDGQSSVPAGTPTGNEGTQKPGSVSSGQPSNAPTPASGGKRGGNSGGKSSSSTTGNGSSGLDASGTSEQSADAGTADQSDASGRKPTSGVEGGRGSSTKSPSNAGNGSPTDRGNADAGGADQSNDRGVKRKKAEATATQVPYDPASTGNPFETLVPRGIGDALQSALAEIKANRGPIDQYVADSLDMSVADLQKAMAAEQIDGVAMAIYQMETGGALIIGDETGIGKGRQAASLIRFAILKGKIPVFFTKDPKLFSDMWGDLRDIGTQMSEPNASASDLSVRPLVLGDAEKAQIKTPDNVVVLKPASNAKQSKIFAAAKEEGFASTGHNAIFATYSQIRDPNARQEFLEWLAANDDIVVVLDEAHESAGDGETSMQAAFMMGGTIKRGKGSAKTEITKSGLLNGQGAMHPRGGVLYLSATFAKRPDNMPVYYRTDLRRGADNFKQVVEAMTRGGVALQQAITEALAEAGQYTRRERDFTGVSYSMKRVDVGDETELVRQVDEVTNVLSEISAFSKRISSIVQASTAQSNSQTSMTDFASIVHNQVGQLLLAAKADAVVDEVVEAHKRGEKPIVALMNTMESFLQQYVDDLDIKPGQPLNLNWSALLEYALSRTLRASEKLPNGDTEIFIVDPADYNLAGRYNEVLKAARAVSVEFPVSPIDYIIQKAKAGGVNVGELTGRESGIDYTDFKTGAGTYRKFKRADKNTLVNTFNNGTLAGLLLNASGSTGLSIHASEKFKDQKPRHMIIAQPALDINVFIQTLGRIKRTGIVMNGRYPGGEAYGARYSHLTLPLNSEMRPAIMAARKMKSLNANTTGESDSAVKIEAEDLMNRFGNQVVAEYLSRIPELQGELNLDVTEREDGTVEVPQDIARKFTGRMALQTNARQGEAYAEIIADYRRAVEQAKVTGDYDLEIIIHDDWDATKASSEQIVAGTDESSIFTSSVNVQGWDMTDTRPTPSGADMLAEFTKENGSNQQLDTRWQSFSREVNERLDGLEKRTQARLGEAQATLAGLAEADPGYKAADLAVSMLLRQQGNIAVKKARWRDTQRRLDDIIDEAGKPVMLENAETNEMDHGMMTQIKFPDITGQLRIAPSAFKMTYLLNRPGGRIYPSLASFKADGYTQARSQYYLEDMTGDRGGRRERRTILVGSPIRAYGATGGKGKVVRFKSRDGELITGIMMPRSWGISNLVEDPRKELADAAAVVRYMQENPYSAGYVESGESVRIHHNYGSYRISAPSARRTGGDIFLDEELRDIVGDFSKNGQRMTADLNSSDIERAAARVVQITGKRFKGQDLNKVRKANGTAEDSAESKTVRPKSALKEAATKEWDKHIEKGGSLGQPPAGRDDPNSIRNAKRIRYRGLFKNQESSNGRAITENLNNRARAGQIIRSFERDWAPFFTYIDDTAPEGKRKEALKKLVNKFAMSDSPESKSLYKWYSELPLGELVPEDTERVKEAKELLPYLENLTISAPTVTHVMPDGAQLTSEGVQTLMANPRAYHGTPHKVDKFSMDKIGTGEGNQAYGWGLYFAESRMVGIEYRDTLGNMRLKMPDGGYVDEKLSTSGAKRILREARSYWIEKKTLKQFRSDLEMQRDRALVWAKQGNSAESNQQFAADADEILKLTDDAVLESTGNLYTVDLLPDEEDFLDWDKPFHAQSQKVQDAIRAYLPTSTSILKNRDDIGEFEGQRIYTWISNSGDKKECSKAMLAAGIPGIRYLDGNSRSFAGFWAESKPDEFGRWWVTNGRERVYTNSQSDAAAEVKKRNSDNRGTYNYVLFDESLVRIIAENGNPVDAALGAPPSSYRSPVSMLEEAVGRLGGTAPANKPAGLSSMFNPKAGRPATGERTLFETPKNPGPAFQTKDLHAAYQRAIRSTSTIWASIRSVFDEAKKLNPSLKKVDFMAQLKAAYYSNLVGIEPSEQSSTVNAAGDFTMRDSLGVVHTNMVFMPTTEAEMIEAAERDTSSTPDQILNDWANSELSQPPSPPIDPTVANQGDTRDNREAFARIRGSYIAEEITQANFDEIREKVQSQIDEDEEGMLDNIQWKVANDEQLSLEEEIARRMLANTLRTRGVRENDPSLVVLADSLWGQDIRDATETARKLAVRVDQLQSPQERLDAAMGRIIAPNRAKLRERLTTAWTPSAKRREIARLEGEIAKAATAASRASLERTLAEAKARMDHNDLIDKMAAENNEAVDKILKRVGLTQADLTMTPDDRHSLQTAVLDLPPVKNAMVTLSPEVQKAIEMSVRGYTDAAIARDTGLKTDVVERVTEHFRNVTAKQAISQAVTIGKQTLGGFIEGGKNLIRWILKAPPAPLQNMVNMGVKNAANVQAQVQAILNAAIPTRRNRNRRALHAAVVNGKKGQKITVFVPYDPTDWQQVYRVARELSTRDATAMNKVYEYWINGILSGPQTHVVNTASNTLSTLWHYGPQWFASATVNTIIRDPNSTQWGEFPKVWAGFMKGIQPAMANFALAWRTEADPVEHTYLDRPVTVMFNDASLEKAGGGKAPSIGGIPGRIIRSPGRFLVAMDAFAKTLIMHGEVSAYAYRLGKQRGLVGVALENFMASQIATHGSESWEHSLQTAKELTFQDENDITKAVEKVTNAAKQAKYIGLLFKFLLPFVRTPTNIYRTGMRKAGGSAGLLLYRLGKAGFYKIHKGENFFDTYSKGKMVQDVSESVMAGALWMLAMSLSEGDPEDEKKAFEITGARPYGVANAGERASQLRQEGGSNLIIIRKNPVTGEKLADPIRIPYGRYEPMALTIGTLVDAAREFKEWSRLPGGEQTADKLAGTIMQHIVAQAQDKTFLQGISSVAQLAEDLTQNRLSLGDSVAKQFVNGVVPNLIRQTLRQARPELIDSKKPLEVLGSKTLGGALSEGQAKINEAGKPVTRRGGPVGNILFPGATEPSKALFDTALKDWNARHPSEKWNPDPITKGDWFIYDPAMGSKKGKFPLKDSRQISLFEKNVGIMFDKLAAQALAKTGYRPGVKVTPDQIEAIKDARTAAIKRVRSMPPSAFTVKTK
jgi:hypothetical protein